MSGGDSRVLFLFGVAWFLGGVCVFIDFSWCRGFSSGKGHMLTLSLVPPSLFFLRWVGIWGAGSSVPPALFRGEAFWFEWLSGHVLTRSLVSTSTPGRHV